MNKRKFKMGSAPKFLRKNMKEARLSSPTALAEVLLDYIYFCAVSSVTKSDTVSSFNAAISAYINGPGASRYIGVNTAVSKAFDELVQIKAIKWEPGKKLVIGETII